MSASDSVDPSSPHLTWRTAIALLVVAVFATTAACSDESYRPGPAGPSPAPPAGPSPAPPASPPPAQPAPPPAIPGVTLYTPPIDGIVREVGGDPLAGQTIYLDGVYGNPNGTFRQTTISDGLGRFQFDGARSRPNYHPHITAGGEGFFGVLLRVPTGIVAPAPIAVELRLQPYLQLTEGAPLETTLSNDDVNYGWPEGPSFGLPVERGPVKVVRLRPTLPGPHILRAEWNTGDRLHLWAEMTYSEVSVEGIGHGRATVEIPADWRDVMVTIGLPLTSRASGGLPNPVSLTLTLTQKFPAP